MVKGHKFWGSGLFLVNLDGHKLMDNSTKFGGMLTDEIEFYLTCFWVKLSYMILILLKKLKLNTQWQQKHYHLELTQRQ